MSDFNLGEEYLRELVEEQRATSEVLFQINENLLDLRSQVILIKTCVTSLTTVFFFLFFAVIWHLA